MRDQSWSGVVQKPEREVDYWDRYARAAAEAVHEPMGAERAINAIHLAVCRIGRGSAVNALASAEARGLLSFRNGMWSRYVFTPARIAEKVRAPATYHR